MRNPTRHSRARSSPSTAGPSAHHQAPPDAALGPVALLAAIAVIVALTLAAYWAAPGHDFVALDDGMYVTRNPAVLGKRVGDLLRAVVAGNYHPLSMLSLAWNVSTPLSPRPFIVTNIALHVANTLLVFWLAWRLSNRKLQVAAFVALLFGIHPMHVESVAWISERKDVLYAFFFLAGLIAYWRYLMRREWPLLGLSFLLFVLSCLAKGMAVVFPVVMVLLDYWQGRPVMARRAVLEKLPFLATSVLFGLVALDVQGGGDFHGVLRLPDVPADAFALSPALSPLQRLILPTYGYMTYLGRVFAPLNLCAYEPYPSAAVLGQARFLLAPISLLATLALMWWDLRRTRILTFGFGWFLVTVALVLQWVPVGGAFVADRYSYLSYFGLFFILGMGVQEVSESRPPLGVALWSICGLFSLALLFPAIQQVSTWKDPEALWGQILRQHPDEPWIRSSRGMYRLSRGQRDLAFVDLRIALGLGYRNADMFHALGIAYGEKGKLDSSLIMLNRGVAVEPSSGLLIYDRAMTYQRLGRFREAVRDLDRALALAPERATKLSGNRGYARMQLGEYWQAVADFDRAIAADSGNVELFYARGSCRLRLGDRTGAVRDFREEPMVGGGVAPSAGVYS